MKNYIDSIIHADCLDVLPNIESASIDFVLTDPPYLVGYKDREGRTLLNDTQDAWLEPSFAELFRVLNPDSYCVSFYGWSKAERFLAAYRKAGFYLRGHFAFPKCYSSSVGHVGYRHECAFLLAKGRPEPREIIPDVLPWEYSGNKLHPTQKPLSILKRLVSAFSDPGGIVLDPFAGSGSSLVAAKELNRRFVGIELDPVYHAAAVERLLQVAGTGDAAINRRHKSVALCL